MKETAMPSLNERWERLGTAVEGDVFQLVDPNHPLAFYVGVAPSGRRLFLLVSPEEVPPSREYQSLKLRSFRRPDGNWGLLLEIERRELWEVFAHLCEDLFEYGRGIADSKHPIRPLMRRLGRWLELLARGRSGLLDLREVRGLFGELVVLRDVVANAIGVCPATLSWRGPEGADQDFRTAMMAWEVKTTMPDAPTVTISSERQLDVGQESELVVVELVDSAIPSPGAQNLNALVNECRSAIATDADVLETFDNRLAMAGYIARGEYDSSHFRVHMIRRYRIATGFPKIVPTDIPLGVEKVSYSLRLAACRAFEISQT